ncbi:MAG: response regulator transcription factor [Xanthomonadales bacterium]|nr:response regulator transcription factor [Xanthomonadales bacterium]
MNERRPTALVADDEPLLRQAMTRLLGQAWPELQVIAEARNGREAVEKFEALQPDVCFLDVQMPGLSGIEAASYIGNRSQLVFVTAFNRYAVQAFEHGALDYLVKPVEAARLATTVERLKQRLHRPAASHDTDALIAQLAASLRKGNADSRLRWIRASVGQTIHLIAVDEIDYLRSDEKYTRIAWRDADGKSSDALIRTPLKEIHDQLDLERFAQVHRAVVVNLHSISHVTRSDNETATIHLKDRHETLPVSRSYLHLFKQM